MFQSKIFRYVLITVAIAVTSSAVLSSSASLQSPSPANSTAQESTQPPSKIPSQAEMRSPLADQDKLSALPQTADMPSGKVLKQLNLSTEQLQKLKAIRDRDHDRIREFAQRSRMASKELRDLLAGSESSDVIRAKHTQVQTLQQELQKQHFERMLSMREILTPQQRSQLNEIMQKNRPDRMREHLQNRMKRENFSDQTTL